MELVSGTSNLFLFTVESPYPFRSFPKHKVWVIKPGIELTEPLGDFLKTVLPKFQSEYEVWPMIPMSQRDISYHSLLVQHSNTFSTSTGLGFLTLIINSLHIFILIVSPIYFFRIYQLTTLCKLFSSLFPNSKPFHYSIAPSLCPSSRPSLLLVTKFK